MKAQLVAFLSQKLLESKVFVGGVHALHDTVTKVQQGAYDSLLAATGSSFPPPLSSDSPLTRSETEDFERGGPAKPLQPESRTAAPQPPPPQAKPRPTFTQEAKQETHRPRRDDSVKDNNAELKALIAKIKGEDKRL